MRAIKNATRRPASAIPRKATSRKPTPIQMNAIQMAGRTAAEGRSRTAISVAGIASAAAMIATVRTRTHGCGRCRSRTKRTQM